MQVARELTRKGHPISAPTVARLLRARNYALRVNRKKLSGKQVPGRDEQFRYLAKLRATFLQQPRPVISVDTKKKELIWLFQASWPTVAPRATRCAGSRLP